MSRTDAARRHGAVPVRGDVVRVRSRDEILATLDDDASLDALPFMPEMLDFCGKELTIAARADKTCDTLEWTGNRRMNNTVHLAGARCDGSAHGGCQASCQLYWREEWLEWPDRPGEPVTRPAPGSASRGTTEAAVHAGSHRPEPDAGAYRCQATELFKATAPMPNGNYRQFVDDVRTGNTTAGTVLRGLLIEVFNKYQSLSARLLPQWLRIRGGRRYPFVAGTGTGERMPATPLQPGDLVEVRSAAEIMATLGPDNRNRQLAFDAEMLPYCGRRARVRANVTRILDETSGKMIKLGDCVVLEDVVCLGLYHRFCQRAITPYWRSGWLRKVEETTA